MTKTTHHVEQSRLEEAFEKTLDAQVALDAIPVEVVVELGRTRLTIKQIMALKQASIIELDGLAGDPMEVLIGGRLIAHGEVVVVNDKLGIRLTDIVAPAERVKGT